MVLESSNDDGITLRERLLQVHNSSGAYDPRLDLPTIPRELEYLMGWFWEIRSAIGGSGFGANPISFTEMKSWCDLTNIELNPWEVSVIKKLDMEYMKISNKSSRDRSKAMSSKRDKL